MTFDILSRNLDVFAWHFLEASAGTGKTFAIEHLVTRLIIEGKSPFLVEQILVVTFTRAAARELRNRILSNLWHAKEELLNTPTMDYLKAICERGGQKEAVERIDAARIHYESAQIYTLHGFCHRMLNEFAFEANVGFEVCNPEEQEHLFLLEQLVKSHLKEKLELPAYSPMQIKLLLHKYRGDFRKMIAAFIDTISSGKKIASPPSFSELFDLFLEEVRALEIIDKKGFKSDVELLRPMFRKMDDEEVCGQIELLGEILETKQCSYAQFDKLLKKELFLAKMSPLHLKVRAKTPSSLQYPDLLETLRTKLLPVIENARNPSTIFLRIAYDLKENGQLLLEKKEKFSPDDLLLQMQRASQSARFVECVRQKYRAAIIDEFQDTDPVQWDIFQKLFINQLEVICLVGDPKQSIYAFRSADVYTYLDAAKAMGASAKKCLDTNFRSTPSLIEALNHLFSRAQQETWMPLPKNRDFGKAGAQSLNQRSGGQAQLEQVVQCSRVQNLECPAQPEADSSCGFGIEGLKVLPVKSGRTSKEDDPEHPLQFFVAVDKGGRTKKFPSKEMLQKKIFPFLAQEISNLHQNGVAYPEIAVLIKDRYMAKEVVGYLKMHGIPAASKRGESITDSIAYSALKELLAAICSPYDSSKMKAALAGPIIAWNVEQLREEEALLFAKAHLRLLHQIFMEQGYGVFFQALLATRWRASSENTLLEEIFQRGDLSLYLDLRQLSELLIEEAMVRNLKGNSYLEFLEQIAFELDQDRYRLRISPLEEKGSVTVMTMHLSKGLEFDTVFALGVASRHKLPEQITVNQEGCSLLTIFDARDPACQNSLEEQDAEKMRQLYVALTRAKKRLYIPLFIHEDEKLIDTGEASPIELFFAQLDQNPKSHRELYASAQSLNLDRTKQIFATLAPHVHYRILEESSDISYAGETPIVTLTPPPPLQIPTYNKHLVSFTALAKKEHAEEALKLKQDGEISPHTLPLGSDTGVLLHLLFEEIFKQGLHHPLDEKRVEKLIRDEIAFSALEPWSAMIHPWIIEILKKKLASHFSLADVPGKQLQQEMEFYFPVPQGIMKGFCDLLFEFEGKYYILDWKSNYLGSSDADYTQEKILQAMHRHDYFLQASIYATSLQRYVKLFDNRPFPDCFGGAIYYFIRGKAVYHFVPELFKG